MYDTEPKNTTAERLKADEAHQAYREHLRNDPHFAEDKQWTIAEIPILAACFIEDHEEALKVWLEAKGISFECGMRDWLFHQKILYERMARVIDSGVKPRGELTNYPPSR